MRTLRGVIGLIALLSAAWACGGGSGGDTDLPPAPLWGQFRQNSQRTGVGFGIVQDNDAIVDFETVDELSEADPFPSAISGSPAIDVDGKLYIGSERGTLAMFEGDDDLNRVWSVTSCGACPAGNRRLGPLVSSPAVYTFEGIDGRRETDVIIGSMDSAVFVFRFFPDEDPIVEETDCSVCFWRGDESLQGPLRAGDPGAQVTAEFASSPTFTTNLSTRLIAGIFIGARITVKHTDGSSEIFGKLYAINHDGSLRWEFPRPGDPKIGAVTSSPALAQGNTIYFTTDVDPAKPNSGDVLYALTDSGSLKRSVPIRNLTDPTLLLSPSVISGVTIFATAVHGTIHALNADGTFKWNVRVPGQRFTASLALGNQNLPTETPERQATPTPTGSPVELPVTLTPTATETPLRPGSTLLGVTEAGMIVAVDVRSGSLVSPTGVKPAAVEGTVVSSPALSTDLFLVYGTTGGQLFSVNTANGELPRFCSGGESDGALCTDNRDCAGGFCDRSPWPLLLPRSCRGGERRAQPCQGDQECPNSICERPAIRSSPAIDLDGTVYFGADDGRVYAVAPLSEVTASPTARPRATPVPPTPTSTHRNAAARSLEPTATPNGISPAQALARGRTIEPVHRATPREDLR